MFIRILAVSFLLILAAVMSAESSCSSTKESESEIESKPISSNQAATGDSQPAAAANQAKIGNLLLTVNGVTNHSDRLFPAEAGTHYVAVDVSAKNMGDKTYSLNLLNFKLKDSDGFANDTATTQGPEPRIGHHDMVPGQEVRGFLVFKIGDTRKPMELQYRSFTGTPGTIKIQ